jgi:hypothetical protein
VNDVQAHALFFCHRQMRTTVAVLAALTALAILFPVDVEAASCRGYPQSIRAAIRKHVEVLRALEWETTDRLKGLDTRPFDYLLGRARATAAVVADKDALAEEAGLSRCRETIPPVRRVCAEAAQALVGLIEEHGTGAASTESKQVYARTMPQCERWMDFAPLVTVFRTTE